MVEGKLDENVNNLQAQNMEIIQPTFDLNSKKSHLPKQYYCKVCGQGFTRKHNMISHELIHSSLKPHICIICNLKFRRVHDLKRHEKLHTGEKPYVCNKCFKGFARTDALVRHQNSTNACSGNRKDHEEAKTTGNEGGVSLKSTSPSRVPILNRPKIFGYNISNEEQFRIPSFQKLAIYNNSNGSINNQILQSPINLPLNSQNQAQQTSRTNRLHPPPLNSPNQIPPAIVATNQIPPPLRNSPNHPIHPNHPISPSHLNSHRMPPVPGIPLPPVSIPMPSIPGAPILSTSVQPLPSVVAPPSMRFIPPPPGYYLSSKPINNTAHVPIDTYQELSNYTKILEDRVMNQEEQIKDLQQPIRNTHIYPSSKSQQSTPTPVSLGGPEPESGCSTTPEFEERLDKPSTV